MTYTVKFKTEEKHEFVRDSLSVLAREHKPRLSVGDYLYKIVKVKALQSKINIKAPE